MSSCNYRPALPAITVWILLLPHVVSAQQPVLHPLEPSDTSSPKATLNSLIGACNKLHELIQDGALEDHGRQTAVVLPVTERILDCLDVSGLPRELKDSAGIEAALFLKEVLDRIELPADAEIPEIVDADLSGPPLRWRVPRTRITIARMEQGQRGQAYLLTADTVRNASQFYSMIKGVPYRTERRPVSPGLYDAYVAATKMSPTQAADTSSPRGTLTRFLDSCNELYELIRTERHVNRNDPEFHRLGQQIISCLDTSKLPTYSREYFDAEAAVCLKELLDRVPLPATEDIPGIGLVETPDGSQPLVRWQVPGTQVVIAKLTEGPHQGEFLFSADTVSRAPELYQKVRTQPYRSEGGVVSEGFYEWWLSSPGNPTVAALVDWLPPWFQHRFLGMALWQWVALLPSIPISLAAVLLALRLGRRYAQAEHRLSSYWVRLGFPLLAILVPLGFKYFAWHYLTLRGTPVYLVNFCCDVLVLLGVLVLIIGISNRIAESVVALPQVSPGSLDANLIRIVCRALGITASVIVFLEGGRYLGFPLTTLIASAGIGGLAVALSAQSLIKGLFGTVTILLDRPFRVGERILVKGHDGVVEEIGLRSTKIRAIQSNNLISIPNDQMADAEIENIGKRKFLQRSTDLHLPLDTPRKQVEDAVESIRTILENHEGMDPEKPPRVFFTEFNTEGFNIRMTYWYAPPDIWRYYEFCQQINFEIARAFEERGIQFSLPARHTYWQRDDEQGPFEVVLRTDTSET